MQTLFYFQIDTKIYSITHIYRKNKKFIPFMVIKILDTHFWDDEFVPIN